MNNHYYTPEGVRDIIPSEYDTKSELTDNILSLMKQEGFLLMQTPSFEYFDVFASFIEIMREKFEQKAEINEQMINEIKKRFEGLIKLNNDNEENEEEGNDKEDAKEE